MHLTNPDPKPPARSTAIALCVGVLLLSACGGSGGQYGDNSTRVDSLRQAQSLLPFKVALPSFLPAGTSRTPEITVFHDEETGAPDLLQVMYGEESAVSPDVTPARLRILELSGTWSLPDALDLEVVDAHGVRVQFAIGALGSDQADLVAAWSDRGTGYQVELLWLPAEDSGGGEVTDHMRAEALKVIESMID